MSHRTDFLKNCAELATSTPRRESSRNRVDFADEGPPNSPDDRDDGPTVGANCRCLNLSTFMGGTRSKVEGEDRHDLEPEGTREDTRHKIYTGSGSQSSYPTSCLE
jgi:hypothetical protein